MKKIELTQGYFALVDDEDYEKLSKYKWRVSIKSRSRYARTTIKEPSGKKHSVFMHRMILNLTDKKISVDHINANGLDNRKKNLRICNQAQNSMNRRKREGVNTSQYKGVTFLRVYHKDHVYNYWQSYIYVSGNKRVHLGSFDSEIAAARAYNKAARELFGEFARINNV